MHNVERAFVRYMLMYVLMVKDWDFKVDDQSEITFVLGNTEIVTAELIAEEIEEILRQVIRW